MRIVLVTCFFSLFLTGCQQMLDTTKGINSALTSLNNGVSGVYVDEGTKQSISAAANKATPAADASTMYQDAKPAIEKFTGLVACGASERQIAAYVDPDKGSSNILPPLLNMSYHKSGCLNVLRINGIKSKAANTLYFKVQYISPQSEESVNRNYLAIKQPDGEWLFAGSLI